jgi:hypothetical protein
MLITLSEDAQIASSKAVAKLRRRLTPEVNSKVFILFEPRTLWTGSHCVKFVVF